MRWPRALGATCLFCLGCEEGGDAAASTPDLEPVQREALEQLGYVEYSGTADERVGVTRYDRARAWPGYNLYTDGRREARVMDMEGRVLHTWQAPETYDECAHFELLADGGILMLCALEGLVRLDADSRPVWELDAPVHHDIAPLEDGSFLVPSWPIGLRAYAGRGVRFDDVLHVSSDGRILSRWSSWDHLAELQALHAPLPLDEGRVHSVVRQKLDYYHLNSLQLLRDSPVARRDSRFRAGNWLVSLRNANLLVVIDGRTGSPLWSWGPGELELQHMPRLLDNGNLLVFDNGSARGWSRVLELEPTTGRITWEYRGDPPEAFFSKWRGSAQRLPGGTTLVAESERGCAFEVTPEGEIVWEFWSPDLFEDKRKGIYRMARVGREQLPAEILIPLARPQQ